MYTLRSFNHGRESYTMVIIVELEAKTNSKPIIPYNYYPLKLCTTTNFPFTAYSYHFLLTLNPLIISLVGNAVCEGFGNGG